jgi:formate dehydrogenase subunit gamma
VIDEALAAHGACEGALLPVLHAVQDRLGFIPPSAIPRIARGLNLSRADVHGVVTFYHDFRSAPPGRHVVKICRAEACQAMGSDALLEHLRGRLGIDLHGVSADGEVSLEPVYCLGNCACGPTLQVDGRVVGRVTTERADATLATLPALRRPG